MSAYDLIIVGAGPAGLSAGLYAGRRNIKTLIISENIGGQVLWTNEVENYLGFQNINAGDLSQKMKKQVDDVGVGFENKKVLSIKKGKNGFIINTEKASYQSAAVILATGLSPRKLGVPGEDKLIGKGVSYCAICDGPFFKKKTVAIVGDGNSAFSAAIYMSDIAKEVYLISIGDKFYASAILQSKVDRAKNIKIFCCASVKEIVGEKTLKSVVLQNVKQTGKNENLRIDGLFIEIGYVAKSKWLNSLVDLNKKGEIIADKSSKTSVAGVFAAGDCTDVKYKQIIITAGQGAIASLSAYDYLVNKSKGKLIPDLDKRCEIVDGID